MLQRVAPCHRPTLAACRTECSLVEMRVRRRIAGQHDDQELVVLQRVGLEGVRTSRAAAAAEPAQLAAAANRRGRLSSAAANRPASRSAWPAPWAAIAGRRSTAAVVFSTAIGQLVAGSSANVDSSPGKSKLLALGVSLTARSSARACRASAGSADVGVGSLLGSMRTASGSKSALGFSAFFFFFFFSFGLLFVFLFLLGCGRGGVVRPSSRRSRAARSGPSDRASSRNRASNQAGASGGQSRQWRDCRWSASASPESYAVRGRRARGANRPGAEKPIRSVKCKERRAASKEESRRHVSGYSPPVADIPRACRYRQRRVSVRRDPDRRRPFVKRVRACDQGVRALRLAASAGLRPPATRETAPDGRGGRLRSGTRFGPARGCARSSSWSMIAGESRGMSAGATRKQSSGAGEQLLAICRKRGLNRGLHIGRRNGGLDQLDAADRERLAQRRPVPRRRLADDDNDPRRPGWPPGSQRLQRSAAGRQRQQQLRLAHADAVAGGGDDGKGDGTSARLRHARGRPGTWPRLRWATSSAQMLTAISGTVCEPMSMPSGAWTWPGPRARCLRPAGSRRSS